FQPIVLVLLKALKLVHGWVGNYGVAIILLTVVFKILFLPFTIKQLHVAQKMSKLRPQLKAIEDKYARAMSDPKQRMEASRQKNAETMDLYGREGVNPAAGCLPLLPQLPVLYAFFALFGVAIELRQAPFVLWIQDLSAPDPFLV